MSSPNHAGNIIVNLAGLPEFLRKPILHKRLTEFFSMNQEDRKEIINNALQAGPTIPFDKFSTLFKTWLETLCNMSEEMAISPALADNGKSRFIVAKKYASSARL